MTEHTIEQIPCYIEAHIVSKSAQNIHVIYLGIDEHDLKGLEITCELIKESCPDCSYIIVSYMPGDWNTDFSPWPAPPVFGNEDFKGCAQDTLDWLTKYCIPYIEQEYIPQQSDIENLSIDAESTEITRHIAGYSLAGLFSLWGFYETGLFTHVVSASGSLWFPNWLDYVQEKATPENSSIYMSLGDKEDNAKQPVMDTVGDVTRAMYEIIQANANVENHILEWNQGKHFKDVPQRIAKGIVWSLQH